MSPFVVDSPVDVDTYNRLGWEHLEQKLSEGRYPGSFMAAAKIVYELAAESHRKETRKFPTLGWGDRVEPYIGHQVRMLANALDPTIPYQMDFATFAGYLGHDYPEIKSVCKEFRSTSARAENFSLELEQRLCGEGLAEYVAELPDMVSIIVSLNHNSRAVYHNSIKKIFKLSDPNALRAGRIKCDDRRDNSLDLLTQFGLFRNGSNNEDFEKLVHADFSVFKTLIVLNKAKRYVLMHPDAQHELLENLKSTISLVAADTYPVPCKIADALWDYASTLSPDAALLLRRSFFQCDIDADYYYDSGGFDVVTPVSLDNNLDGTVDTHNQYVFRKKEFKPSAESLYTYANSWARLLRLLSGEDYHIMGL